MNGQYKNLKNRLNICENDIKRISPYVKHVLHTMVEIRSDPYATVAPQKQKGRRHKAQPQIYKLEKCEYEQMLNL